ncbi:Inversin [Diplogelasinospora grovesii]|uniref:Inversin n=1 Tax=Diplogelasinospora grovesii TaxID=303347 RepID=A0AAN6NA92_9PEZI|nr:Inversin [Diplogelasinospora grovesii]
MPIPLCYTAPNHHITLTAEAMDRDSEKAKRLLLAKRSSQNDEKAFSRLQSRFFDKVDFTYKEVNQVLREVVEVDGPIGVVKALLALGADVNYSQRRGSNTFSKITGRQQQGQRNDVLLLATVQCRADTVYALAGHADQENLDGVLHHALLRGDVAVLKALVDHGANPAALHDDFQNAVFLNQVELVKVLLSGYRLPCSSCRSTGLGLAVKNRSLQLIRTLLKVRADINYNDAAALLQAVDISRPDLVGALISGPVRPSPRSLDAAVGRAREVMGEGASQSSLEVIEICLAAGASGPETNRLTTEGLVGAIARNHARLVDSILRHKKPSERYETLALVEAVRYSEKDMLASLVRLQPCATSLTAAINQAVRIADAAVSYELTQLLVEAGAHGACAAKALVLVVQRVVYDDQRRDRTSMTDMVMDRQLFSLLLDEGRADVNYKQGEALRIAVRASCAKVAAQIVAKQPSPDSLGAAVLEAMRIGAQPDRAAMIELLLRTQVSSEAAGKALVEAFKDGPGDVHVVELLLRQASVNYNNGEVFAYAIRNFRPDNFRLLLSQGTSYKALFTAVMEALRAPRSNRHVIFECILGRLQLDHLNAALKHLILEDGPDLGLVKAMLDAGAEATFEGGLCIKHAACNLDRDTLHVLTEHSGRDEIIYTQAFSGVISRGKQWIAFEHLQLIQLLLRHGAGGQVVNRAMVEVVDHLACQASRADLAEALLNNLFAADADVNYENGKAVGIAAGRGDPSLVSLLLGRGATTTAATHAFSTAIMTHHEESLLLRLVDVFADPRTALPDVNQSLPGMPPPLLLCLKSYGNSVALLDRLVEAGCDLELTVRAQVHSEGSSETEQVSVLMWALLQPDNFISSCVVWAMIRHGANVSFATPSSRTTPLLVAVKSGRPELVRILLDSGAKASARDALGRSALFYASRDGSTELVALLLKYAPSSNDGSLHEASRNFHVPAMKLLIDAGHDPNYRSGRHGGRTALGEMALHATIADGVDATLAAEEALDVLCAAGANPLLRMHGKTAIFLALENQKDNECVTRVLLDKLLYRTLNSQENIFQQDTYHYSPTMYVSKGILLGPHSNGDVLQLLRGHGGEDRFYASMEQTQPHDAVGMPEEIMQYEPDRREWERRNRRAEEEHAAELRREKEKALAKVSVEDLRHETSIWHGEELSQQERRLRGLDHNQVIQINAEKHHNDAQIKSSGAALESSIRWHRHKDDLAMSTQKRDVDLHYRQKALERTLNERTGVEDLEDRFRERRQLQDTEFRSRRHALDLKHMQAVHGQRLMENNDNSMQRLYFTEQQKALECEHMSRKRELQRNHHLQLQDKMAGTDLSNARAKHQMRMAELDMERGNLAGGVTLEQFKRWQESRDAKKELEQAGDQGKGKSRPQTKLLTVA